MTDAALCYVVVNVAVIIVIAFGIGAVIVVQN